ncbi:amidohydrolase family protein [Thermosipho ferrireducens]|uniref:Amidohydrolase family protein n=1 Tax=Thermosipho ferrireducens TaxID=2571116 RepID=A0ABX7S893_9BACT|nr:amidohydrolase family protein [Thermosipho ferrireducens]QTA37503.1 amidohydrolase family protein [Thermosipho ferrireducens]
MSIRIKNAKVWNGRNFEKKDLYINSEGIFVSFLKEEEIRKSIDLESFYVFPGFVDSHAHVLGVGIKKLIKNLEGDFVNEILKTEESIIVGRGWSKLPDNINKLLDFDRPVILIRRCGHVAWINNKAKNLLKLKENMIFENELEKIWSLLPEDFYEYAFKLGEKQFLKSGVTCVHSDDFHGISFETLKKLLSRSEIRIYEKLYTDRPWDYEYGNYGISEIFGIKIFADGSLGGKTAFLSKPYKGSENSGVNTLPHNFSKIIDFADRNGLQVCVHAIGDQAVTEVLNAFGRSYGHRIIHAQIIKKADFERLKNFVFSIQPHFYFEDLPLLENIQDGEYLLYPFFEMYRKNIDIAFSTDSPVSPENPWYVIQSAVKMGFSLEDSIKLYTEHGGKIIDKPIGKISPGYYADFVVYEKQFYSTPKAVFVGGKQVFGEKL